MNTEQLENSIVEKLKRDIENAEVRAFPGNSRNFSTSHQVGAVLVQYVSSSFTEPRVLNSITQTRNLSFSVFVLRRDLRDHAGAYGALDAVRRSLTGFSPPGASKIYPVSEKFLSEQSGIWVYEMVFSLQGRHEEHQQQDGN